MMNLSKITAIIGIICLGTLTALALDNNINKTCEYSKNICSILQYSKENQTAKAIDLYKQLSESEKNEFVALLERQPGIVPPFYFIDLADYVYKTDKDKAVFFFYFGKLRATEDVLMCKDETARAQLSVYPLMAPDTLDYMSTKYDDMNYIPAVLQKTIDWDNANPERVSPIWSCYHGLDAFSQEPVLLDADKFPKIQKKVQKIVKNSIKEFKKEYKKHF